MEAPSIRYAETADGKRIAFTQLGSGPPLVYPALQFPFQLQLELTESAEWFKRLATSNRLVLFDVRGVGHSGPSVSEVSFQTMELDLEAVLTAVTPQRFNLMITDPTVTPMALQFAAKRPGELDHLLLWQAYARSASSGDSVQIDLFRRNVESIKLAPTAERVEFVRQAYRAAGVPDDWSRSAAAMLVDAFECWAAYADLVVFGDYDFSDRLSAINTRVLILNPTGAEFTPQRLIREVASGIAQCQLVELASDAALPWFGDRDRITEVIAEFLGSAPPASESASANSVQTVLFTDLAGSTAMQTRLGDAAAREVVRTHDAAMRHAIEEFHGREVKHTGDGMMATFGSAADAVSCALAVKRDIATYNDTHQGEELLVRFGLNAGEPIAEDDDLFGLSVTLAARIGDWGEPGQVLVSDVVRQLLLGKGFEFTSVGSAELKGLDEPVPLYEVDG